MMYITRGDFQVDLAGGDLEQGQLIRVTHRAGIGQTGWRRRILRVTDIVINPEDGADGGGWRARISWEDVHQMFVKATTGVETPHADPGEDEPLIGFHPLGTEGVDAWTLGS